MTMADTIAVMRAGKVEQLGSPENLYERPATAYVANFLGQSNLLEATVLDASTDPAVVDVHGARLAVPGRHATGARLQVGVRPEKMVLSRGPAAVDDALAALPTTVTDVVFTGLSTQYVVRTAWGQELVVFAQNVGTDVRARPGDDVVVRWQVEHAFVLGGARDADDALDLAASAP